MRRFHALLITAGLAAAPASAAAGPSMTIPPPSFDKIECSTTRAQLGMEVMPLTPELRKRFGSTEDRGVMVARVQPMTPAALAGMEVGDVIVDVRGKPVADASDVRAAMETVTKGQSVPLEIVRDGKRRTVTATIADGPLPLSWLRRWFAALD